jgi:hypothetical protein
MSQKLNSAIAVIGIDIGKNSFHLVGLDKRGAIVLRQKWSRGQVEARLVNMQPCLIGMEACVGAHHLSRKLQALGRIAWASAKVIRPHLRRRIGQHATGPTLVLVDHRDRTGGAKRVEWPRADARRGEGQVLRGLGEGEGRRLP